MWFLLSLMCAISLSVSDLLSKIALRMAIVRIEGAYMISIKRTSPVFSVLLGCWLLHEKNFIKRFVGSIIMFLAVLLIIL